MSVKPQNNKKNRKKYPYTENDAMYLKPKRRKGILRIFFSRAGITALMIGVQIWMLWWVYDYFRDYSEWFSVLMGIFSLLMIFHLFACDMDSTAKLTWLIIMMSAPVPGAMLLWFTENDVGHRAIKKRISELIDETRHTLTQDVELLSRPDLTDSATDALCRYISNSGCFPIYEHTQVKYFPIGEKKFESLMREIKKAKKFIFMEYFIIDEGEMWGSILKILAEKAKQGVDIRIMYDGMCEISTLSSDYPHLLSALGIKCKPFSPIHPFLSTHYNYRDHRKILVIDGKVAYNGGVNLADEYVNLRSPHGHWKDTAVMLKGEAVQSFTLMFLQMWNLTEKEPKWDEFINQNIQRENDGYVMPFSDCPLDSYKVGENVYLDILNRAKHYVYIMTPYLILDNELESALKYAAERGVDVRLILPGIPDKKIAYSLAKSYYKYLVEAGVKIYEYTPGFVHAKVFVSDGEKAVVGTINLDYRSLYHHFECATYMYKTSCIADIEKDFADTLSKCRRVTPETIKNEKIFYKLTGSVMRIAAPLM